MDFQFVDGIEDIAMRIPQNVHYLMMSHDHLFITATKNGGNRRGNRKIIPSSRSTSFVVHSLDHLR
jgi:hypothetical protein